MKNTFMVAKRGMRFGIIYTLISFLISSVLFSQTEFPYTISLEPVSIQGLPGIHSFAQGQSEGKWVIIGGRLDGIHARQPFNAFPSAQNNDSIRIVDPIQNKVWAVSLSTLPVGLKEQLQSTNLQFYQDEDQLIIVGGYAFSQSEGDHITFPYLTLIDLPGLIDDVINERSINENFKQITHNVFAVTGGYLGKIGEFFQLVGGHRFDGRYNPMGHGTFVQSYTNAIRKFKIDYDEENLSYNEYSEVIDPVNLHRRDYNLLPQIYPNGEFGYTIFSGVFQLNADLPFLFPVDITSSGYEAKNDFNQYLCNYHTANAVLFDANDNATHNLFFGGISQYFYDGDNLIQDNDVPFVRTISRVSRASDGKMEELKMPQSMPGYLGAGAELILNDDLPLAADHIVDISMIDEETFLLGHIVGGIESESPHAFVFNNSGETSAAASLFKVYLTKNEVTSTKEIALPGYHEFDVRVIPNPSSGNVFNVRTNAPESGYVDILMTDTSGKLILNEQVDGLQKGENEMEMNLDEEQKGMFFLTLILNGKYTATTKLVLK